MMKLSPFLLLCGVAACFILSFCSLVDANLRCTADGQCVHEEPPRSKEPPHSDNVRCTTDGRCETNSKPLETRVSATGQELKDKVLRLMFEVWAGNDFSRIDEFVSTSHVFSSPMLHRPLVGHKGLEAYNAFTQSSFSDYSFFIDDLIHEDNKVVARFQFFGINTGEYEGMPATGQLVRVPDCLAVFDFWGGKIQQTLLVWPHQNVLTQLTTRQFHPTMETSPTLIKDT